MPTRLAFTLLVLSLLALRLAFGLYAVPVQPMADETQTYLIGLKYFSTGAWPFYGNDVVDPTDTRILLSQDPGALEGLLIGLPLRVWPSPLSPFLFLNLLSTLSLAFLAWYGLKRVPGLSPWFVLPWFLTAPWCLHYTTGMMNFSFSMTAAVFFFTAFLEATPPLSLRWMPAPAAFALMGLSLCSWVQLHRTWVLAAPFAALSLFLQARENRKASGPLFFLAGALPPALLILPTLLRPDYHFFRDVTGLSFGFNFHNFLGFFTLLFRFLSLACFELPRFLGLNTAERLGFLSSHPWLLPPGLFLWIFGMAQAVILLASGFLSRGFRPGWKAFRLFTFLSFLWVYVSLLFTVKQPDVNTFCELLPIPLLYSLYVGEAWWRRPRARAFLWFFLGAALFFQVGYVHSQYGLKGSFYLQNEKALARAVQERDYRILGERRAGSFY